MRSSTGKNLVVISQKLAGEGVQEKKSLKIMALNQSNPDDCKLLHPLHLTSDFALTECDGFTCFLVRILMHIYVWSKKKSRLYLIMQNYHFLPD